VINICSVTIVIKLLGEEVIDGRLKLKLNRFFDDVEELSLDLEEEEEEQSIYSVIPNEKSK
jgi:hypothetical protein